MTTGGAVAVVAGVAVVGGGIYFVCRQRSAIAAGAAAAGKPAAVGQQPAVTQLANGLQSLNQAGCQAIAGKYVGGAGAAGCKIYTEWFSPIGATTKLFNLAGEIPVVGGAIKTAGNTVAKVASVPIKAVENFLGGIF